MDLQMSFSRRVMAALLVLVLGAAEIAISVPRFHNHAGSQEQSAPHECLACRVFTLVLTLPDQPATAPPRQQTATVASPSFIAIHSTAAAPVRGRAPPAA